MGAMLYCTLYPFWFPPFLSVKSFLVAPEWIEFCFVCFVLFLFSRFLWPLWKETRNWPGGMTGGLCSFVNKAYSHNRENVSTSTPDQSAPPVFATFIRLFIRAFRHWETLTNAEECTVTYFLHIGTNSDDLPKTPLHLERWLPRDAAPKTPFHVLRKRNDWISPAFARFSNL